MAYANGQKAEWNRNGLASWVGEGVINITKTITEFFTGGSRNAAGGIRLNAQGGYRFHGAGAIATRAVPLDIVGEDGAEAIVPLTNKRYSLPFAKTLAEQMAGIGDRAVNNYYTIDGVNVTGEPEVERAMETVFRYFKRAKGVA